MPRRHPDAATGLGDHRFDDRLPDLSGAALAAERRALDGFAARLTALDDHGTDRRAARGRDNALREHRAPGLRAGRAARAHLEPAARQPRHGDLRPARQGFRAAARPARQRGRAAGGDTRGPRSRARQPRRHAEGAHRDRHHPVQRHDQAGTNEIDAALRKAGGAAVRGAPAWPRSRRSAPTSTGCPQSSPARRAGDFTDPRISPERFARKLSLTLSAAADPDALLARAEADLDRITGEIAEVAASAAAARRARCSTGWPPTRRTRRRRSCSVVRAALAEQTGVRARARPGHAARRPGRDHRHAGDQPRRRGRLLRLARPAGAAAAGRADLLRASAPTPADWSAERVASFYREYNGHMVRNLTVHEAMPGHFLQLPTRAGSAAAPGCGGAASRLVHRGLGGLRRGADGRPGTGLRRPARGPHAAAQDAAAHHDQRDPRRPGAHRHGMTEAEAMALMTDRGFQEEGEAAGKWRRALLTSPSCPPTTSATPSVRPRRRTAGDPGPDRPHGARRACSPTAPHRSACSARSSSRGLSRGHCPASRSARRRGSPAAISTIFTRLDAPDTRLTALRRTPNASATAASAACVALPSTALALTRTTRAPSCSPPTPGCAEPGRTRIVIRI